MGCKSTEECIKEINAYVNGESTGYFLLVNTENYDRYQEIRRRLEHDRSKTCLYLSRNCSPAGLPDVDRVISQARGSGKYAVIGLSQALMLRGAAALGETLGDLLGCSSIQGHCVILLDHCESLLQTYMNRDPRVQHRVVLLEDEPSPLPKIQLAKSEEECIGIKPLPDVPSLLARLEELRNAKEEAQKDQKARAGDGSQPESKAPPKEIRTVLTVVTSLPPDLFADAMYAVTPVENIYDALTRTYPDVMGAVEKSCGTEAQWKWLAERLAKRSGFADLVQAEFGSTSNLSVQLTDVWTSGSKERQWLLWLALKVFGERSNRYLTLVLGHCHGVDSFIEHIYLDLAEVDISDPDFTRYFTERKNLLEKLPEDAVLMKKYCDKLVQHGKDEVLYLTDGSEEERYHFVRCLAMYEYTGEELDRAVRSMSEPLRMYMEDFVFDAVNTKLPDADSAFRGELTAYFREYKRQKLTNRISPEFLEKVETYAQSPRPYNKLPARSYLVSRLDRKNMVCFFFDALGVEYLSFILARCEAYGLSAEVAIGHCELPSITSQNKEFLQYFADKDWKKIDDLDEMLHDNSEYDYEKCEYPVHLFKELAVIDKHLKAIQGMLVKHMMEKALIVADHGASRLAVLYSHKMDASIALEEKGEHSGRCCQAAEDPCLPFAAYENGYAVLANYERFKGGRRAEVEVHGGATLEEVLVPIITLTMRPEHLELTFADSTIMLKPRVVPELVLCANMPFKAPPRLCIDGEYYDGVFEADKRRVKFALPKIRRARTYEAEVYEGGKKLPEKLTFEVKKQTREVDLF